MRRHSPSALLRMGLATASLERTTTTIDAEFLAGIFPDLEIGEAVGRGGFGAIWRVQHRRLQRALALKILDPALTRDPTTVARFEREMLAVGQLDHPGIVRAHDAGQRSGVWFLAMEFIEGADLGALSAGGLLPVVEACEMVRQAALALGHAHGCGLVHRDVKPRNLMLARDGVVKVLDFGLAQLAQLGLDEVSLTASGEFLGSLEYIAPEQVEHPGAVDARADIYGLGATLYRLLTAHTPHGPAKSSSMFTRMKQITTQPAIPVATLRPDLPSELAALVDRMLELDREARPATAAEVVTLLTPFCVGANLPALAREWSAQHPAPAVVASIAAPAPLPKPLVQRPAVKSAGPFWKRRVWLAALTTILVVVALEVGWVQLTKNARTVAPGPAPATPAPESWQDLTRNAEKLQLPNGAELTADGLLIPANSRTGIGGTSANGALRIRAAYNAVTKPVIMARASGPGSYGLYVFTPNTVLLQFWDNEFDRAKPIQTFPVPTPVQPGQEYELELRAVGSTLTVKLNGQTLGSAEDSRLPDGPFVIWTSPGGRSENPPTLVRSIEFLSLEPAPERWQDFTRMLEKVDLPKGAELTPDGLLIPATARVRLGKSAANGAIRVRAIYGDTNKFVVMARTSTPGSYGLYMSDPSTVGLRFWDTEAGTGTMIQTFPIPTPVQPGQEYELELRAVGSTLTVKLNGQTLGSAEDSRLKKGIFIVYAIGAGLQSEGPPTLVRSIEILDLDPAPEPWQDIARITDKVDLPKGAERTADGLLIPPDGQVGIRKTPAHSAIRIRTAYDGISKPVIMARASAPGSYGLVVLDPSTVRLRFRNNQSGTNETIQTFPIPTPLQPGQEYELELRAVGSTLTARLNGQTLGSAEDSRLTKGYFIVLNTCGRSDAPPTLMRSIEILDLDRR